MPHDVGVDYRNGDLYVLDSNNKRVQIFSREGSYKREFPGRFVEPFGISVHPKGDFLCVADPGSREVVKFSLEGQELARYGGQGSAAGKFRWSRDCAIDEQGHIYVADTDNERAQKLDAEGNFMGFIIGPNTREKGSFHPRSIAVNSKTGEVYAAAAYANRIDRFNSELKHIQSWGAHNKDGPVFSTPRSIAVNPKNGEIYVGDFWDHRVRRFDSTGKYLGSFDGWAPTQTDLQGNPLPPDFATTPETVMWVSKEDQFFPVALSIDADSNIWVIREAMHYDDDPRMQADWIIRRYTADGRFIEGFGSPDFPRNAKMRGMALDPSAQVLYIANSENHRLMKFDFKGNRLWAVGGKGSAESQFNWPAGVALDPQRKRLYVVDVENNRVQKFDTDGNFIKSWGKAGKGPGEFAFNGFSSIAVDDKGYVYVGDTKNARVQVFDPEGRYINSVGQPGQGAEGKWNNFSGIAVLKDRLYVVDTNGYEIEIWKIKHGG
jgi:tripartite motif-containing protein 71